MPIFSPRTTIRPSPQRTDNPPSVGTGNLTHGHAVVRRQSSSRPIHIDSFFGADCEAIALRNSPGEYLKARTRVVAGAQVR